MGTIRKRILKVEVDRETRKRQNVAVGTIRKRILKDHPYHKGRYAGVVAVGTIRKRILKEPYLEAALRRTEEVAVGTIR